jgi:hypothetical protein
MLYLPFLLKNLIVVYTFILTFISLTFYYIRINTFYLLLIRLLLKLIKLKSLLNLIFTKRFIKSGYTLILRNL